MAPEARQEALAFLDGGGTIGGDCFASYHDPRSFVQSLYLAGAKHVAADVEDNTLVATLPIEPDARARLFAIYNAEVDRFGEEFGGEATRGHEISRDEALAMGHPEAEGEWCVDDLHAVDSGQETLTFWWD